MTTRVLLCDDEPHILKAAQFKLQKLGFAVALASNGEEAWEILQLETPEILVTDFQMPLLDGISLARRIYQDDNLRDLPIVLLTAKGLELSQDECLKDTGIFKILTKPFSPRKLGETICQRLNLKLNGVLHE